MNGLIIYSFIAMHLIWYFLRGFGVWVIYLVIPYFIIGFAMIKLLNLIGFTYFKTVFVGLILVLIVNQFVYVV